MSCGFDKINNFKGNFPIYSDIDSIITEIRYLLPDIIVDFSSPEVTNQLVEIAYKNNIPIVIATTGLSKKDIAMIKKYAEYIPIFQSANMSFDVALLKNILKNITVQLSDVDIEISETHHNQKKDSPSGTAKMLAEAINETLGYKKKIVYGRVKKRKKNEIGISSIRGGNIVGEHTIQFFSNYETLEIKHTVYSRKVFVEGALKAVRFLIVKEPGLYNMDDLIASM